MNIPYELVFRDDARWVLDRLRVVAPAEADAISLCIDRLGRDPFPDPLNLAPFVIPGQRVYPHSFKCTSWRIAFGVLGRYVIVSRIGRWPPTLW